MTAITAPSTARARQGAWLTIRRGLRLSPELRRGLPGTLFLALLATAGRVIIPIAIQQVIDGGLRGGRVDMAFIMRMCLLALGAVVMTGAATGWMHLRLARVAETALSGLRIRAFRHIHDLSMLHQASEQRGALVSRVTSDVDEISRFMQWAGLMLLTNGGQAFLAVVVMFFYSPLLGGVVAASVPLIILTMRWFQTRLDRAYLTVRERVGRMLAVLAEVVVGAPVIRAYGIERRVRRRLATAIEDHRRSGVRAGALSASFSGVAEVLSAMVLAAVVVVGTILAVDGTISVGTVIAFLFLVQLFIQPVQILGEAVNEAQTAVAGWRRVLDVLDLEPDVSDPGREGVDLPDWPLGVTFESVTFRYPRPGETAAAATGHAALMDIDVRIEPRQKVAVVGETGSGKTTFAKLLTRLMDPTEGVVRVGDVDVSTVRFESLRDRVVMVPQEGMLFSGTVGDNVRMGRPEAKDADVRGAFHSLGLQGWLAELAAGLDTPVGERGGALSVGERQLVTLVRAAIADPDLLVLDEATSAVDPATEVRITRAMEGLASGRTVVTIAHRLSTAEKADRVLVFDDGRIVQDGNHADLIEEGGVYRLLFESWRRGTAV
ncbi:MAG TPA: ABC transporter ATP-binding protein [Acidimicrobiia bacterium]|nr:ABC transporter ATP-binding protein [Acidimicrobiia bacterium]